MKQGNMCPKDEFTSCGIAGAGFKPVLLNKQESGRPVILCQERPGNQGAAYRKTAADGDQ